VGAYLGFGAGGLGELRAAYLGFKEKGRTVSRDAYLVDP
jgi:hypothetical protein